MLPLITLRLQNQLLVRPPFDSPQQVVEWMGAIQAQDYRMAKWAVGCRTASTDATQIEAALNRGDILRTHLLRPTWHFVSSKDLRWMLSLTADRIRAANESFARGTDAEFTPPGSCRVPWSCCKRRWQEISTGRKRKSEKR